MRGGARGLVLPVAPPRAPPSRPLGGGPLEQLSNYLAGGGHERPWGCSRGLSTPGYWECKGAKKEGVSPSSRPIQVGGSEAEILAPVALHPASVSGKRVSCPEI